MGVAASSLRVLLRSAWNRAQKESLGLYDCLMGLCVGSAEMLESCGVVQQVSSNGSSTSMELVLSPQDLASGYEFLLSLYEKGKRVLGDGADDQSVYDFMMERLFVSRVVVFDSLFRL